MTPPVKFSELGIKPTSKAFTGDKIKIDKLLNRPILINDFKVTKSKFEDKGSGRLLTMQITYKEESHIVFTGSATLIELIEQVPPTAFPIETTIEKNDERYVFT